MEINSDDSMYVNKQRSTMSYILWFILIFNDTSWAKAYCVIFIADADNKDIMCSCAGLQDLYKTSHAG